MMNWKGSSSSSSSSSMLSSSNMVIISSPKLQRQPPIICFTSTSKSKSKTLRCCSSLAAVASQSKTIDLSLSLTNKKPSAAEVSRTIMELSSVATFSTSYPQDEFKNCSIGVGVRFAVDPEQGTPIVCLNPKHYHSFFSSNSSHNNNNYIPSSLNVQLEQCGLRTTQCTIQGILQCPQSDQLFFKSLWEKRFGEKADAEFIHLLRVERVLQMDNFMEDGVWVTSSEYKQATADPLRACAEHLVHEINTHNMDDVLRFCNIYVDSDIQVSGAKMVWVDRLGFDIHLYGPQNDVYEVRIPFPREVTNEKGAKSSFNGMAQLAWEVEKNYHPLEFEKVKHLKKIASKV
ncbi:glutamyl-tRNA reductase-binding protein, chloroplastic [Rutidosis leptorrhynchoides]|uniref:glutamyl-tRNA reductase-binding protein, chloroplastic n=1 Tax=Rutidosis leptorrhynchoides TaxID=125765 RepID=UPI003A98D3ED